MGNKNSKDARKDCMGNKINEIISGYLTQEKVKENRENVNVGKISNEVVTKNCLFEESCSRASNIILAAVNVADRINASYTMSKNKIDLDAYSAIMMVEKEKLSKEFYSNFFEEFDQFELIQKFFNYNNKIEFDDKYHYATKLFTTRKRNNEKANILQLSKHKIKKENIYTPEVKSELRAKLSEIKIVETDILRKNDYDNTLGSIVIPKEMFDKSFEEMSLQEYLNIETQRLRLNKPGEKNEKVTCENNKNKNFLTHNTLYTREKTKLPHTQRKQSEDKTFDPTKINLIRNKHLENNKNNNNNKFNDLSLVDRNVKKKMNFKEKDNLKMNNRLNYKTMKSQFTNFNINLQSANTARSEYNNNKNYSTNYVKQRSKSKVKNNTKSNGYPEGIKISDAYRSNKDIRKCPPIASIRIDIRELMKNENLDLKSDDFITYNTNYPTDRSLFNYCEIQDLKNSNDLQEE